jgi:alpha-L-rhamnosidase
MATRQLIVSDDNWKFTADGPIRTNNEYDGEEYDATKEMPGWNNTGFNDAKWLKADLVEAPGRQGRGTDE